MVRNVSETVKSTFLLEKCYTPIKAELNRKEKKHKVRYGKVLGLVYT